MTARTIALLTLLLGSCAPMLEMREGEAADQLRNVVRGFCEARASGDVARIAAVFERV